MEARTHELVALGHRLLIDGSEDDAYFTSLEDEIDDEALSFVGRIVTSDATVADIGANIGVHAITLAKLAPDGHVHAFEPVPATAAYLTQNVRNNAVTNLTCHAFALGSAPGSLTLYENREFTAGSTVVEHSAPLARNGITRHHDREPPDSLVTVLTKTLDDVVEELGLQSLDIVKIDAEGHDLDVLRGATHTLSTLRPIVVMEFATFALTAHRQLLPTDALGEIRRAFDRVFVVERWGKVREMRSDQDAWDFLWENANVRPVQDLVGAFEDSRLLDAVDALAAERDREGPPPPEPTEAELALDAERARSARLSEELESAHADIAELRQAVSRAEVENSRSTEEIARLDNELESTRRTLSWRITRPLRAIRRRLPP